MKNKLFISNIDFEIDAVKLREIFSEVGTVVSLTLVTDKESGKSRGYAFLEMASEEEAQKAIEGLDRKAHNGRPMSVAWDHGKQSEGESRGGSGDDAARSEQSLPPMPRVMPLVKKTRKLDPFLQDPNLVADYKSSTFLQQYLSERGRILPRRLTGLSAYHQRKVAKAIKRSQNLGLLPFTTISK